MYFSLQEYVLYNVFNSGEKQMRFFVCIICSWICMPSRYTRSSHVVPARMVFFTVGTNEPYIFTSESEFMSWRQYALNHVSCVRPIHRHYAFLYMIEPTIIQSDTSIISNIKSYEIYVYKKLLRMLPEWKIYEALIIHLYRNILFGTFWF